MHVPADNNCLFHAISMALVDLDIGSLPYFDVRCRLVAKMRLSFDRLYSTQNVGAAVVLDELSSEAKTDWFSVTGDQDPLVFHFQAAILSAVCGPDSDYADTSSRVRGAFESVLEDSLVDRVNFWLDWLATEGVWGNIQMAVFVPVVFGVSIIIYYSDLSIPGSPKYVRGPTIIKSHTSPLMVLLRTTLKSGIHHWELIVLKSRDMSSFLGGF
jgi:hypothetical protein